MTSSRRPDRGVTPVVGLVLLVAVVVVLAGVAAGFLFTTGGVLSDPAPTVSLAVEGTDDGNVVIEHAGGDSVDGDELEIRGGEPVGGLPETFGPGTTIEIEPEEDELRVTWNDGDGGGSVLDSVDVDSAVAGNGGADDGGSDDGADDGGSDDGADDADGGGDDGDDGGADDADGGGGDDGADDGEDEPGEPDFSENPWLEDSQTDTLGVFYEQDGEFQPVAVGQDLSELPDGVDPIYVFLEHDPDEVDETAELVVEETDGSVFGSERVFEDIGVYDGSAFAGSEATQWAVQLGDDGPQGGDDVVLDSIDEVTLTVTWKDDEG